MWEGAALQTLPKKSILSSIVEVFDPVGLLPTEMGVAPIPGERPVESDGFRICGWIYQFMNLV